MRNVVPMNILFRPHVNKVNRTRARWHHQLPNEQSETETRN